MMEENTSGESRHNGPRSNLSMILLGLNRHNKHVYGGYDDDPHPRKIGGKIIRRDPRRDVVARRRKANKSARRARRGNR